MVREGYNVITLDAETLDELKQAQDEGGYRSIPETIRALLKNRATDIDHWIELILPLVNEEADPFSFVMLDLKATRRQVKELYNLLEKVDNRVSQGKDVTPNDFESEVGRIFNTNDYHITASIVSALSKQRRFDALCRHMKKAGMNLSS